MTRMSLLSSPLLLGFEEMERLIDRVGKGGDAYPPYNIERIAATNGAANGDATSEPVDRLRITLAVAGFKRDQLEIMLEENQLVIRGPLSSATVSCVSIWCDASPIGSCARSRSVRRGPESFRPHRSGPNRGKIEKTG